jgi:DNA-binding transcriptional LysR family regulator
MYFEIGEIRSFVTLARELHFGRAAEQLFISQPALSKQIRHLEEKIGGKLFARTRRKVTLTEPGRFLLPLAHKLLRDSEFALITAKEASAGRVGLLRIGFGLAAVPDVLPRVIVRFSKKYPAIKLQMRDLSTPSQVSALLSRSLDVGMVRLPIHRGEIETVPILHERLLLVVPASFQYGPRDTLSKLRDAPFVLLSRSASATFHDHALSLCRVAGFAPKVVQESGETFTILNFVRAGLGVSLVQSTAARMNVPGIHFHELKMKESQWTVGLAWLRASEKQELIRNFVNTVQSLMCR